jgi:small subunit ribosomal protein S5
MAEQRNQGGGRNRRDNKGRGGRNDQQKQEPELREKMVALNRVSKVTKGGRTFTFAAIVVVGDGKGKVGSGAGKARDISEAIQKATDNARKSMIKVPLHKGTIPHEQLGKYGAGKVGWCYACRSRHRWCEQRTCQVTGIFQPTQRDQGYHRCAEAAPQPDDNC